eukprot:PhM_4_TR12403/c0_g1_i1/m.89886/K03083/GSK3B; glycogen synthase kinase 3 beta
MSTASATTTTTPSQQQPAAQLLNFIAERVIGQGSCATVVLIRVVESGEMLTVKRIPLDSRHISRELELWRDVLPQQHPSLLPLRYYFFSDSITSTQPVQQQQQQSKGGGIVLTTTKRNSGSSIVARRGLRRSSSGCSLTGSETDKDNIAPSPAQVITNSPTSPTLLQHQPHQPPLTPSPSMVFSSVTLSAARVSTSRYVNCVSEYVPETLARHIRAYTRNRERMPLMLITVLAFQLLRGVAALHTKKVAHRDLKPQNILIDVLAGVLKIGDFGSAKQFSDEYLEVANYNGSVRLRRQKFQQHEEALGSVSYVCSRWYRAPELLLGSRFYTTSVDMWSVGCIIGEMMVGAPLFMGESPTQQFVEIMKYLGTPSRDDVDHMTPFYEDFRFPGGVALPGGLKKVLMPSAASCDSAALADLVMKLLVYNPFNRLTAWDACCHAAFRGLRAECSTLRLPHGALLPSDLFVFSAEELASMTEEQRRVLMCTGDSARSPKTPKT